MSRKNLVIWYALIIVLGIAGARLGSTARDLSDVRFWLGAFALLGAVAALVVIYRRDLAPSEREKTIEWQRTKAHGRTRFIIKNLLLSQVVWLSDASIVAAHVFQTRSLHGAPIHLRSTFMLAVAIGALSLPWSLFWWHRQERLHPNDAVEQIVGPERG